MAELLLKYTDPNGVNKRIAVGRDEFTIGRQPDCDLAISDSRLSRKHACIRRSGAGYTIEDRGSSNGTDLNGEPVFDPVDIRNGDVLSFGGVEAIVELVDLPTVKVVPTETSAQAPQRAVTATRPEPKAARQIPIWLILLVPALAGVLVIFAAGITYVVVSRNSANIAVETNSEDPLANIDTDGPGKKKDQKSDDVADVTSTPKPSDTQTSGNTSDTPPETPGNATPTNLSETQKTEVNGAGFLRKIAQKNPTAFLTSEQAQRVSARIKQFNASSALAENIKSARKNENQIKDLAAKKNLKPQLLAVAALAKLGNSRGDVYATAESMSDVLFKLSVSIGTEFADDCLLTIAVYDQGAAGDTMKLRNMLQDLATKSSESSRTIRSIWFLQKNGKITQAEYDKALTFLAIGTIAQNPKDFGVNAEALSF